jgi:hypothetical protein
MKTAIAFTGGVDSTFLAYKILTETADTVRLFRIDYRNDPVFRRVTAPYAEEIAGQRVADWLAANVRPVEYITVNVNAFQAGEWSSLQCVRTGAEWVRDGLFDRLMIGRNMEARKPNRGLKTVAAQRRIYAEIVGSGEPEFPLDAQDLGKPHAHATLPPALLALALVCKRPQIVDGEIIPCSTQDTTWQTNTDVTGCKYHMKIQEMLATGDSPAVIVDYVQAIGRQGAYYGLPGGDPAWFSGGFPTTIDFPEKEL